MSSVPSSRPHFRAGRVSLQAVMNKKYGIISTSGDHKKDQSQKIPEDVMLE